MKSQIKNKKNGSRCKFVELLIPTLNKIISYQFLLILLKGTNYERSSQNNQSAWCFPPKVLGGFFSKLKKAFHGGTNFSRQNIYGEVILNGRTND